ncbi:putative F-box protein At3g58950 [Chenopodium quinoa]|uniref:putative F-box protein At3g58950 n=1 Tax=Chenopodium quinoa TaxID=63459 RepID=UPI000B76EE21|nr:putative F-box protein At3g58950 [Chenopodium quinoa]
MGESTRKCKTRRNSGNSSENKDIISSLPDEILGRILSYLPTKYAVATTALSSRWKNIYKLISVLDFDDSVSLNSRDDLGNERSDNAKFKEFVKQILSQFERSHISKFRLKCGKNIEYYLLYEWIIAAFCHEVDEFELSIDMPIPCVLQLPQLFCENLVVLKLDGKFILRVSTSVTFPRLRVLFFKEVTFHGYSSIRFSAYYESSLNYHDLNGMLARCPLLEELVIDGCDWNGLDLYFTNPLLKRLTLIDGLSGPIDQLNGSIVHIDLPKLVYFKYSQCLAERYSIRNLNSVMEAHLVVCFNDDDYDDEQDLCNAILDLITGICSCQSLYLSSQCLEALTSGDFELPIFRNMTLLDLTLGQDVSWSEVLLDFLYSSPCLESLTLAQDPSLIDGKFLLKAKAVPSCVKSRLKFININDFRGYKEEIRMVKYFLDNAHGLKEMVICWDRRSRKGDLIYKAKEILELPKSSKSCSIAFE